MSGTQPPARSILPYGDRRLRQVCREVPPHEDVSGLAADMLTALRSAGGVGLAAPQIGDLRRVIVCRPPAAPVLVMINPVIEERGRVLVDFEEGCLSFNGLFVKVRRPRRIRVRYRDLGGVVRVLEDGGLPARIVQHEVDHLHGVLLIDHLPLWRRWLVAWPRWRRRCGARERAA